MLTLASVLMALAVALTLMPPSWWTPAVLPAAVLVAYAIYGRTGIMPALVQYVVQRWNRRHPARPSELQIQRAGRHLTSASDLRTDRVTSRWPA